MDAETLLDLARGHHHPPALPSPKGPRSARLLDALGGPVRDLGALPPGDDPLRDDDTALALYLCYEQHYRGWPGVDDGWEWEPSLLRERRRLEDELEAALLDLVGAPARGLGPADAAERLVKLSRGSG